MLILRLSYFYLIALGIPESVSLSKLNELSLFKLCSWVCEKFTTVLKQPMALFRDIKDFWFFWNTLLFVFKTLNAWWRRLIELCSPVIRELGRIFWCIPKDSLQGERIVNAFSSGKNTAILGLWDLFPSALGDPYLRILLLGPNLSIDVRIIQLVINLPY